MWNSVTENQCVFFNSLTYVYIYIYTYIHTYIYIYIYIYTHTHTCISVKLLSLKGRTGCWNVWSFLFWACVWSIKVNALIYYHEQNNNLELQKGDNVLDWDFKKLALQIHFNKDEIIIWPKRDQDIRKCSLRKPKYTVRYSSGNVLMSCTNTVLVERCFHCSFWT